MTKTKTSGATLSAGVAALTIVITGLFGGGVARADSPTPGGSGGYCSITNTSGPCDSHSN